jgi:hypothetical protein
VCTGSRVALPDDTSDPVAIGLHIGARLDAIGVGWVVAGSIASSVHGEPRATQDVDMVVALEARHVTAFLEALGRDYYVDSDAMHAAVEASTSFNAVHFATAIKVDFFVAGDDPFEAERLAHRQRIDTPDGRLYVDTAEHTLLRKLEWYRRDGEVSERPRPRRKRRTASRSTTRRLTGQALEHAVIRSLRGSAHPPHAPSRAP